MRKQIVDHLEKRKCYFRLGYYDRNLAVPFVETYFFLGRDLYPNSIDGWFFQSPDFFLEGASASDLDQCEEKGIVILSREDLDDIVDWEGLVCELSENKKMQDMGKFLSQRT